jgi:hypothetical protein
MVVKIGDAPLPFSILCSLSQALSQALSKSLTQLPPPAIPDKAHDKAHDKDRDKDRKTHAPNLRYLTFYKTRKSSESLPFGRISE